MNSSNSRYALVEGLRSLPEKGLYGQCEVCGGMMIAHFGSVLIHHWAYQKKINCDPWREPLSAWHIEWQDKFPNHAAK